MTPAGFEPMNLGSSGDKYDNHGTTGVDTMKWCFSPSFPCTSGTVPVTQPGTTPIHNRGPKYRTFSCIFDILNSFAFSQSACTVGCTPIIEHAKLNIIFNLISFLHKKAAKIDKAYNTLENLKYTRH